MAKFSTYALTLRTGLNANAGQNTLVVPYKVGDAQGDFDGDGALLIVNGGRLVLREDTDTFTIVFGASDFTVTWHDLLHSVGDTDDVSITTDIFATSSPPTGAVVPQARLINTTSPLAGGGDLSADRTLSISTNGIGDTLLRQGAAVSVIGRSANSTGNVADIAAGANDRVLARESNALAFVQVSTAMLATNAVTDAKLRQSAAVSVIGRSANSIGDVADIAAGANDRILVRTGDALSFAQLALGMVPADLLDNTVLANMAAATIKGRASGAGTGDPTDLTGAQVATILGALNGLLQVGDIVFNGGTSLRAGCIWPAGQNVSRTTYAALFAVYSTQYGVGDGSTTFGVPDLRGRGLFGKDDMNGSAASRITNAVSGIVGTTLGAAGGAQSVLLVSGNIPTLTLTFASGGTAVTNGVAALNLAGGASGGLDSTGSVGTASPTAVNKMPPAFIMNFAIFTGV